jgi:hypothetical protein
METSETAILTITNITGGAINGQDSSFVLTINDNDTPTPPSVRFVGGSSKTSVESVGNITLTIGILNPNANPTSVNVVLTGGTATNGTDFTYTTPTTVTFPANSSTNQTITIPITDDAIVEASETMTFTLTNATNTATVASPANFTQTITDNDTPASTSVVTFATTTDSKSESAGSVSATFTITNPTTSPITVSLTTGGTATFGTDYGFITSNPVTIPANATTFSFLMNITDDAAVEPTETAIVKIASVSTGSIGTDSVFTLSITDNDGMAINTVNNTNAITVAPNPVAANGTVFVKTNTTDKSVVFELYNILGVKVATEMVQQNRVNLNGKNLNTGVYFYKVISNQEVLATGRMMLK